MTTALSQRLAEPDVVALPDWAAADRLNAPDPNLPPRITLAPTRIGPGTVMAALGPSAGAALLDSLTALAAQSRPIHWALTVIMRGELDLNVAGARDQVDQLAAAGVLTSAQASTLKALAEVREAQSWAQVHNIEVTARTVGLVRGAKE